MKTVFTAFLFALATGIFAQAKVENVDASTFRKYIDEDNTIVLIDLRTEDEIKEKGKIKGAEQIDFLNKDSEAQIKSMDKKKTYLIYCAGGGRSGDCAELMQKEGFKRVINLEKGFDDWKKKGYETVMPKLNTKY
jgi:rhodanese-related sulfurtransferase